VLMLVFKYLLDGPCAFPQALGVVSWSMLPGILNSLAALAVMLALPAAEFDLKNPVGINLGYYLGPDSAAWIKSLLTSIDFFSLWTILLLATGMSVITRKSWGSALGAVLIPWGFYVVIKTAFAAVFG
ncbi:MAG: YIP1 family protein, partial [Acidobacteriota bacterium]